MGFAGWTDGIQIVTGSFVNGGTVGLLDVCNGLSISVKFDLQVMPGLTLRLESLHHMPSHRWILFAYT